MFNYAFNPIYYQKKKCSFNSTAQFFYKDKNAAVVNDKNLSELINKCIKLQKKFLLAYCQ